MNNKHDKIILFLLMIVYPVYLGSLKNLHPEYSGMILHKCTLATINIAFFIAAFIPRLAKYSSFFTTIGVGAVTAHTAFLTINNDLNLGYGIGTFILQLLIYPYFTNFKRFYFVASIVAIYCAVTLKMAAAPYSIMLVVGTIIAYIGIAISLKIKLKLQKELDLALKTSHELEKNLLEIKVEQERQLASTFKSLALFDQLTGLPNRTHYNQEIEKELAKAERNKSMMGVLFLDLDGFKKVNDTHGHEAGDEILRGVATVLKNNLRKTDFPARLAGDEFVIILSTISGREGLQVVAEKIIKSINELTVKYGEAELKVGCSIGGAVYPNDGADSRDLTKHADYGMMIAKRSGKNRFYFG